MTKRIVLYSLQTFSSTGGIQKMTRTLAHALHLLSVRNNWDFKLWSAYDNNSDLMKQYLPAEKFTGFGVNRISFVLKTLFLAKKPDVIIISHINLAIIGLLVKVTNPGCKVWLIAHGIEVWRPLSPLKKAFLRYCDKVVCVSKFTKAQMISRHGVETLRCEVLNNAVDSFMKLPTLFTKPAALLKRYRIPAGVPVIFTLTRLASTEQYKGHDQVIKALPNLKAKFPGIKYILAGQYDHKEEIRIQRLISEAKVDEQVILTGFIDEAEIADHFLLADLFVLPSKKEGFGIVFIEALACGLPVICGNSDGSIDAICNGELGKAINVDNLNELENAITDYLESPVTAKDRKGVQAKCLSHFNEADYINKLEKLINE
ncbi:glycosyltransferase family 4 protein [Mucilaginibacter sp. BJC16-A38]|uniref:glycosyltransferase family 4 protein n=1 Tax=Mucilaginibacter phenanthrenivorans TaxID=1234842 RepID=UPI0021574B7D|nr:glycosyltransferase family 4 protein [Mucilaginibacter phenanthrenivorans]MCR8560200.1 glycosyltransferase family 4 protein [Mucilaginibacter phenanthrenivorans]